MKAIFLSLALIPLLLLTGCAVGGGYYSDYPGYYYDGGPYIGVSYYGGGYHHGYHHYDTGYHGSVAYHGSSHASGRSFAGVSRTSGHSGGSHGASVSMGHR
jgi:hypothetical protein